MGWVAGVCSAFASLALVFACSSSSEDGGQAGSAGSAGQAGADGAAGSANACASCALDRCDSERAACQAEASCIPRLECLRACPANAAGIDSACASACPPGETSAARAAGDALASCASAAAQSCSDACAAVDAGTDSGPDPKNPWLNQVCEPASHPDACNDCMWNACCDSMEAILQGGPATDLAQCWQTCTTDECEKQCYAQHSAGSVEFGGWWSCLNHHCAKSDACGPLSPCSQCIADNCSLELADCQTNYDCHMIQNCANWCETSQCSLDCPSQHPGGKEAWDRYFACVTLRCSNC